MDIMGIVEKARAHGAASHARRAVVAAPCTHSYPPPPPPPPGLRVMNGLLRPAGGCARPKSFLLPITVLSFAAHGQPATPTGLEATPGDGSATLAWSNPSDSTITGYSYRFATSVAALAGASWNAIAGSGAATTSHTLSGLANGTRYHFRLRATNGDGDGAAAQATIQLAATPGATVTLGDGALRDAVESALGKSAGATITQLDMATLTTLRAAWNGVVDLAGMERAVNLRRLYLGNNSISDISALGALTSLTRLELDNNNAISDVSALGTLTSLSVLRLQNNAISDISALGTLTSLTELWLHNNSISDVSALGTLTSLSVLRLQNNAISDVSALGTLTSLTELGLHNNSISDVSALGALTSLGVLSLHNNAISDVSSLRNLAALWFLDLAGNDIANIGSFAEGTVFSNPGRTDAVWSATLREYVHPSGGPFLDLTGNTLDARSQCHVPALRRRGVRVLFNVASAACGPPPAPDLTAVVHEDGGVVLRWTPAGGAGYELRHAQADAELGDWTVVADEDAAAGSHRVEGLAGGFSYVFELRAVIDEPGPSARVEVTLPALRQALVRIADPGLAVGVANTLGKEDADMFTRGELATITMLDVSRAGAGAPPAFVVAFGAAPTMHGVTAGTPPVSNLVDVELLVNLRRLNLDGNAVRNLEPLLALRHLAWLSVYDQPLTSDSVRIYIPALRARGVEVLFDPPVAAALADVDLRLGVERALGKAPGADLTEGDLLDLRELDATALGVRSLTGLGAATNLERLWLGGNRVDDLGELSRLASLRWLDLSCNRLTDIAPLAELTGLMALSLACNAVEDVSPLAGLTMLEWLDASDNRIANVSPLAALARLERLRLGDNRVADIEPLVNLEALMRLSLSGNGLRSLAPLSGLSSLEWLDASDNLITDVSPLWGMSSLTRLRLGGNRIADIDPLVSGAVLGEGDMVGLRGNPLSAASLERHVPALRARGVAVLAGVALPYFPAASEMSEEGGGREGFARVANRSAEAGEVLVAAVDAAGTRRGPARLALGPGRTTHFNSRDLEDGNVDKGLWPGVGSPGVAGAWWLELTTTLDVEAAAYVRTADGFVAPVSGCLPRAGEPESLRAGVFNPGRNLAQRSVLRVWNPGVVAEAFSVWAVDDAGSGRLAMGWSVPAGGSMEVDAARLESTPRSGWSVGEGKRRLSVRAPWPVEAMSLLESAGSRVSDLSSPPSAGVDGLWRAPLFPAASAGSSREGFVRVSNRGAWPGEVLVTAVDDGGRRAGPVALTLGAGRTVHFNSRDLRDGAPAKGLAAGVGEPTTGDWRLEFTSELNLRVSSFARSADGFLTSMGETAPRDADGASRVFFFNPGSNRNQASLLRLVNDGNEAAAVVVTGVADTGAPGGEVRLTIPAGAARTLTAAQLEAGGEGLEGALGDGTGKWRLTVASDNPVTVMSLLESATGHLANLSASVAGGKL